MLTKLNAVNAMLATIGEAPVTTISSGSSDAALAVSILDEVCAEAQEPGWHANTENVTLTPDTDGVISIAGDILSVSTIGHSRPIDAVVRTDANDGIRKLYNLNGATFVFTAPLRVEIIRELPFDDLTPPIRSYVKARACRIYQERALTSNDVERSVMQAEAEAYARMIDAEAQEEPSNLLTSNPSLAYARHHARMPFGL